MKTVLRACFALVFGLLSAAGLHAGNLRVTISPTQAVSAGAQWQVDGGNWRNSGATVNNLSNTSHTVTFKAVSGWLTPAPMTVTLTAGNTTQLTATYVRPASLSITLTPSSGQWRIDGGTWRNSGTTATGLTPGAHTIDYSGVSGYAAPASESVTLVSNQTTNLSRTYTQLAQLQVHLNPNTAQWRIDGGAWRNSGTTATNLSVGTHTVEYGPVSGYITPPAESVTLAAGQSMMINIPYTPLSALTVTLTPSNGQWRVDGGAWQASGATVPNLQPGQHTLEYSTLAGYSAPALSETITLFAGQNSSLSRSYIHLATLTVTLTPGTARWRFPTQPWRASGTTATDLTPYTYSIEYESLPGYIAPASESVTLAPGQSQSLNRAYVQLGQISIVLNPSFAKWRVNGGAWNSSGAIVANLPAGDYNIEYSTHTPQFGTPAPETATLAVGQSLNLTRTYTPYSEVSVALVPTSGQWRIDGGAWQASGASRWVLAGTHTIDYAPLAGYTAPASESITLATSESQSLNRSYTQLATLTLTLTPTNAQWRVDGGAWQDSGVTVANLTPGAHTVEYTTLAGYSRPAVSETITLTAGQNASLSRSYTQLATLTVMLTPASAQWRISGTGTWVNSGTTVVDLAPGNYTIEYAAMAGYTAPASEVVALAAGQTQSFSRAYVQLGQITVTLTPSIAQWRIGGTGTWQNSGTTVADLTPGSYTIEYASLAGYTAPAAETVTLSAGQALPLNRGYVQLGQITLTLDPSFAQWRLNGGAWQTSGTTATNLAPGNYTIEYSSHAPSYGSPATETLTLAAGQLLNLSRSYIAYSQVSIGLVPTNGQWRIDEGAWQASGATLWVLPGSHTIDYAPLENYDPPVSETISTGFATTRYYTSTKPKLRIHLGPSTGQWRLDGGAWQASGTQLTELAVGAHTIDYTDVGGDHDPLASETVNLALRDDLTLTRGYPLKRASLTVTLNPANATWSIDGGALLPSGATVTGLAPGNHTIAYGPAEFYVQPSPDTITLTPGQAATFSRSYAPSPAFVSIRTFPNTGQWRLYPVGTTPTAAWSNSEDTVQVPPGDYSVEYTSLAGYTTPATETITLTSQQYLLFDRAYTVPPAHLQVTLDHPLGAWRIETQTGSFVGSGSTLTLVPGTYTINYYNVPGYATPPDETVTLAPGKSLALSRSYTALPHGSLSVTLDHPSAQWNVNNGAWQASGATVTTVPSGPAVVRYSTVSGYITPAQETVTIVGGQTTTISRSYVRITKLTVTVGPFDGYWRVDGGQWRASGTSVSGLSVGTHTIEYEANPYYDPPATETITVAQGDQISLTRAHTPITQVSVSLYPSNARWRLDGGAWQANGFFRTTAGSHTIEFEPVGGYITPAAETITVVQDQTLWFYRSYVQYAQLTVGFSPPDGQWRVDGGAWQTKGATVTGLMPDVPHTLEFSDVVGYVTPSATSVTLTSGESRTYQAYYMPLAALKIGFNAPEGRWRVDGGAWQTSNATVANLAYDTSHLVEYLTIAGYVAPASHTVTLYSGQTYTHSAYYTPLASLRVGFNAPEGRWRVDGGEWQLSNATVANLTYDTPHLVEYLTITGYVAPASHTVTLYSGQTYQHSAYYNPLASLRVGFNVPEGRWRVDGGAWQLSNATVANLAYDTPHTVEYITITGYVAPASHTVTMYSGQTYQHSAYYNPLATVTVTLNQPDGRWRVDGGAWQLSSATVANLSYTDSHRIEFMDVRNYATPNVQVFTAYSGQAVSRSAYYDTLGAHAIRFYVHPDLVGVTPIAEVRSRLSRYAAHLLEILHRETNRTYTFQESDVMVSATTPFSGTTGMSQPTDGFGIWVHATLTDNATLGTYGGTVGVDSSGAGGVTDLKFDQIHNPDTLVDGSPEVAQYWRQLHLITRNIEQMFGAGKVGYDSLGGLKDASGVAPILPDVAAPDSAVADAFWNARFDYWTDPLTANAHANARLGSPTSVSTLRNLTTFAPATRAIIARRLRYLAESFSVPNMSAIIVRVVDAQTGAPIPAATLRIWNRATPVPPHMTFEETVTAYGPQGEFRFEWTGAGAPFATTANAKLLKAFAPGYVANAQWVTVFDAQAAYFSSGSTWVITIALTPQ